MAKGLVPDKPPVPARPKRPVTRPGSIAKPVVAVMYAAQTAMVDDEARTVALNAASRIRHLLAKGLASRSTVSSRKENEGGPVAQSPSALLSKFRAAQSDLVERDKTVDALKDMLRRGGAPDAAIDRHVDKHLFPSGVVVSTVGGGEGGGTTVGAVPNAGTVTNAASTPPSGTSLGITPGVSRELMEREIKQLRAALAVRDGVVTSKTTNSVKKGGGGDFAARDELNRVASSLERLGFGTDTFPTDDDTHKKRGVRSGDGTAGHLTVPHASDKSNLESRLAAKLDDQTVLLKEWVDDESRRLREELFEKAGETSFARDACDKARLDLRKANETLQTLRVTHARVTAESSAATRAAEKASEGVASALRTTLEALHETVAAGVGTTAELNSQVTKFERNSDAEMKSLRSELLEKLLSHSNALDKFSRDERHRREELSKNQMNDEETFAMLCETAAASARDASESNEKATALLTSIAFDVAEVRGLAGDTNEKLDAESATRAASFKTATDASVDARTAVTEVRLNQRRLLAVTLEQREVAKAGESRIEKLRDAFAEKESELKEKAATVQIELCVLKKENDRLRKECALAKAAEADSRDAQYLAEIDAQRAAEAANETRDTALREITRSRTETLRKLTEARVAYETAARVGEAEEDNTSEPGTGKEDSEAKEVTDSESLITVRLEYPGSLSLSRLKSETDTIRNQKRAFATAARVAAATVSSAEAEQHRVARLAAEIGARDAGRMLRELAADLCAARAEIGMLRNATRRQTVDGDEAGDKDGDAAGDAGDGIRAGDEAWDVLRRAGNEAGDTLDTSEGEPEASLHAAEASPEAAPSASPSAKSTASSVDLQTDSESKALREASKLAREKLRAMLAGTQAYLGEMPREDL